MAQDHFSAELAKYGDRFGMMYRRLQVAERHTKLRAQWQQGRTPSCDHAVARTKAHRVYIVDGQRLECSTLQRVEAVAPRDAEATVAYRIDALAHSREHLVDLMHDVRPRAAMTEDRRRCVSARGR